ncbi:hypothetical protein MKX01_014052 [Papaver californicum]|nr:hypothetical protein MKX01_014052 [Papaver californicum]
MNTDPCTDWTGVLCNYNSTVLKKIILDSMSLPGTFDAVSLCAANGNRISGSLPSSLSNLKNLKKLDISDNYFSGALPDFTRISGLVSFIIQNNSLTGEIPQFDFMNLQKFNVSFNYFTRPIPDLKGRFSINSFLGNPGLCGYPLPNKCPPSK